jgi:hypothetical protein
MPLKNSRTGEGQALSAHDFFNNIGPLRNALMEQNCPFCSITGAGRVPPRKLKSLWATTRGRILKKPITRTTPIMLGKARRLFTGRMTRKLK